MTGTNFYKFYFDGVLVDEPVDWKELTITFTESSVFPGIVFSQAIPATFVGSGYTILLDAFEEAICSSVDIKIQVSYGSTYSDIFNGVIFLNSVVFDYSRRSCDVEIKDNSFLSKIENNKDIRFKLDVPRSKNDETITAVTAREIDFFTPSTGTYDQLDVECYDAGETLRFLVQAMTDGDVTAETTFLDSSGLVFCLGSAILTPGGTGFAPQISFKEAFEELHKKLNLTFIIETPLGETPVIKIEPLNDIFVDSDIESIDGVRLITGEGDKDKYYQLIDIGSNTFIEDAGSFTFPSPAFLGTRREQYHLLGVCNSSNTLDLVGNFIVDSNVIEDIIVNNSTDYNDNVFIIQTDRTTIDQATKYDDIVDFYYNKTLMNEAVASNFFGAIPNSIANYLGNGDDGFIAQKATTETITVVTGGAFYDLEPVEYATEISDPNANYDNATYYYEAPQAGSYSFFASLYFYVNGLVRSGTGVSEQARIKLELVRYVDNTFASEIESLEFIVDHSLDNLTTAVNVTGAFYLTGGNTVRVRASAQKVLSTDVSGANIEVEFPNTGFPVGSEPQFRCVATENGGGVYFTYDEADVRNYLYSISQYPLQSTKFKNIVNNIGKRLAVTGIVSKKGWIKELVWNPYTNDSDIQLRSKG